MKSHDVRCARVYEPPGPDDGVRVLVDRLWPRGLRKDTPGLDAWIKDAAPSAELRSWYGHDPKLRAGFRERYLRELGEPGPRAALDRIRELAGDGTLTLLTASREIEHSHVEVLAALLRVPERHGGGGGEPVCLLPRVCPECGSLADEEPPTICERCGAAMDAP